MKTIVVATNNQGKLAEIKEILKDYHLLSLKDVNCQIEVEEDQETFEGNAKKKAKTVAMLTNMPCIADDSGLCIEVYQGWPGVHTDRFLGRMATPKQKNEAILEKMKNRKGKERKAKVVSVVTYYENEKWLVAKGEIEGKIAEQPRGDNGFGFDPIFELKNGKTYAQLSKEEKNAISHRRKALEKLRYLLS